MTLIQHNLFISHEWSDSSSLNRSCELCEEVGQNISEFHRYSEESVMAEPRGLTDEEVQAACTAPGDATKVNCNQNIGISFSVFG